MNKIPWKEKKSCFWEDHSKNWQSRTQFWLSWPQQIHISMEKHEQFAKMRTGKQKKTQFSVKTSPFHLFFDHRKRSTLKLWEIVFKRPGILPRIDNNIPIQNDIFETIDANDFDDEYTTAKVSIRGRAETRIFLLQRFYVNSISMVLKVQNVASLTI